MTLLITAKEVISSTGLKSKTDTALIGMFLIDAVQEEYIRPLLGKDLYDLILSEQAACVFTGVNKTLLNDYIVPVLAQYVWLKLLPQLHIQSTNSGLQINNSEFANPASSAQRAELSTSIESIASSLSEKMIRYMEDNEDSFDDWSSGTDISSSISKTGGIIL